MTDEADGIGDSLGHLGKNCDVVDFAQVMEPQRKEEEEEEQAQPFKEQHQQQQLHFTTVNDSKKHDVVVVGDKDISESDAGVQQRSSSSTKSKQISINTNNNNNHNNKNNSKTNKNHKNKAKKQKNNHNKKQQQQKQHHQPQQVSSSPQKSLNNSDIISESDEDDYLSTSPDSANGELIPAKKTKSSSKKSTTDQQVLSSKETMDSPVATSTPTPKHQPSSAIVSLFVCTKPQGCLTLHNILDSFKTSISEEQAWALLYQLIALYKKASDSCRHHLFNDFEIPESFDNVNVHRDGSVHYSWTEEQQKAREEHQQEQNSEEERGDYSLACIVASHKKVIRQVAVIVYGALDFNLPEDDQYHISQELEDLFNYMTSDENEDDCIDEGIDEGYKRWDDDNDYEKINETKEFDYVLEACKNHIKPTVPDDHYKAVCRALVTEALELRIFLQQVLTNGGNNLHLKVAESKASQQELAKLGFTDWARFWVQVIEELRRGVRLKAVPYSRAPIEFELTPYEILMEDIRSKKYQLRKVMVNGDIPPRVKKDAHAVIMDFIRSRPPLKKASERKLPPPIEREPSPREQLMDSIRKGQTLKHVQPPTPKRLKDRLLLPTSTASSNLTATTSAMLSASTTSLQTSSGGTSAATMIEPALFRSFKEQSQKDDITPRNKQRLIEVDLLLLQHDDNFFDESSMATTSTKNQKPSIGVCSQPKMPPYPIGGYMVSEPPAQTTTISKAQQQPQMMTSGGTSSVSGAATESTNIPSGLTARVLRRTTYDLATQCESRRASLRRHTIVGCQSNFDEAHSTPSSRPESRQSDVHSLAGPTGVSTTKQLHNTYNQQQQHHHHQQQQHQQTHFKRTQSPNCKLSAGGIADNSNYCENNDSSSCSRSSSSVGPWNKSFMDEKTWNERGDDRLSLTLEEIVHIRSVMTKAELEALPVGVRVKEDVEKRKVCFLCLRTRFSIFGPWGIQCKLCQRTVCSKCYTKMRIPAEHFRNVPLVLISPSLLASPASSSTPSPSRHIHSSSTGNILDDNFPKTLIERLLSKESEQKARNSVGSAPSSPKHQRSNMSTPGLTSTAAQASCTGQAVEAIHHHNQLDSMTQSYTAGTTNKHSSLNTHSILANGSYAKAHAQNKNFSLMSRSMEGPRSMPANSPARPHSNSSTLDRKSKFSRAFALSSSGTQLSQEQKENLRGELVPVCNDCKGLVNEITRSGKQKRSSARNRALQNLTLDLSPVWK